MNAKTTVRTKKTGLFRYKADRLPISLFLLYFALDVAVFFLVQNPLWVALWALSTLLPKACICAWNHHQQHCATFRKPLLNRLLEVVYGLQTGAIPFAWTLHHNMGHHMNYLDQKKDESRWARKNGQVMGTHEYSFNVFITAYPRILTVSKRFTKLRQQFLTWATITGLLLLAGFIHNPINLTLLFLIPMAVGLYVTAWHTYYHHAGLYTDDHDDASYNVIHRWYNRLTGNLGYHTAHHQRMGLHWSALPEYHAKIAHKIPAELYKDPCIPFRWIGAAAWKPPEQT